MCIRCCALDYTPWYRIAHSVYFTLKKAAVGQQEAVLQEMMVEGGG